MTGHLFAMEAVTWLSGIWVDQSPMTSGSRPRWRRCSAANAPTRSSKTPSAAAAAATRSRPRSRRAARSPSTARAHDPRLAHQHDRRRHERDPAPVHRARGARPPSQDRGRRAESQTSHGSSFAGRGKSRRVLLLVVSHAVGRAVPETSPRGRPGTWATPAAPRPPRAHDLPSHGAQRPSKLEKRRTALCASSTSPLTCLPSQRRWAAPTRSPRAARHRTRVRATARCISWPTTLPRGAHAHRGLLRGDSLQPRLAFAPPGRRVLEGNVKDRKGIGVTPELIGIRYSPWTEKARWSPDHRIPYRYTEHLIMLGMPELRVKTG